MNEILENERRIFTERRKQQGFVSQEHLDAFYRYFDHRQDCPICNRIAGYAELPSDGSLQPYCGNCEISRKLDKELNKFSKYGFGE